MITWLQRIFDRHKYLVVLLFTIVIVSFVFVVNESGGLGSRDGERPQEKYFGVDLGSAGQYRQLRYDILLSQLMLGRVVRDEQQIQALWEMRLPLLQIAQDLQIPGPTAQELPRFLEQFPMFQNEQGRFSHTALSSFEDMVRTDPKYSEEQFWRIVVENYQIQRVENLLSGSGYVQPFQVSKNLEQYTARWNVLLASQNYTDFQPEASEPTQEQLQEFYRSQSTVYELPEQRSGYAVRFRSADFLVEDAVEDRVLQQYFERNLQKYLVGEEQAVPEFAAVREQVLSDYRQQLATRGMVEQANEFVDYLYKAGSLPESDVLAAEVVRRKGTIQPLPAFSRSQAPAGSDLQPQDLLELFTLKAPAFYTTPAALNNQDYLILLQKEVIPARLPSLTEEGSEQLLERVKRDYAESEKRRRFREQGTEVVQQIREKLKEGGDFAEVAGNLGFTVAEFKGVSLMDQPEDFPQPQAASELYMELMRSQPHHVSRFVADADKGYVLYTQSIEHENSEVSDNFSQWIVRHLNQFYGSVLPRVLVGDYIFKETGFQSGR